MENEKERENGGLLAYVPLGILAPLHSSSSQESYSVLSTLYSKHSNEEEAVFAPFICYCEIYVMILEFRSMEEKRKILSLLIIFFIRTIIQLS